MNDQPIIIIGAGIAGLLAARELLRREKKVILLEAGNRLGGRIHTLDSQSPIVLEAGAEFIHGTSPLTFELLQEYHIGWQQTGGEMLQIRKGKLYTENRFEGHWDKLMHEMGQLREDTGFADFLSAHFSGDRYENLRRSARGYAEGYDVADINVVSTLALYEEWNDESTSWEQHRVEGGYGKLVEAIAGECSRSGCSICTSEEVVTVEWGKNIAYAYTKSGKKFTGSKIVITVPLGVLQQRKISFIPAIDEHLQATDRIGFGSVIKILLCFKTSFWNGAYPEAGFFFTGETIPTWWTQFPQQDHLLTGWLGGPPSLAWTHAGETELIEVALQSLAAAFNLHLSTLRSQLIKGYVFDWAKDPFSLGAYSFPIVPTKRARAFLKEAVEDVLFFAGEGWYEGPSGGTVEAALVSARDISEKILSL